MPRAADTDLLNLDPLYIPGMIEDVQTDGAVGGVNYHLLHANTAGLLVVVQAYLNMQENDWIEVFWGDDDNAVASNLVLPEDVGEDFGLFIPANRVPEGVNEVYAKVTRSGGGNGGESPPLAILVRTLFPGGTDPEPDLPGHQNLPAPEPELPPGEIIDEEAAKNGIKVSIGAYPNMRRFDTITFSWGGILLDHEVSQAEVDAGVVEILVTEDTILAAGDSDQLVLVYKVTDEVHNPSSDWSIRTYVAVEIGKDLFNAPIIENPDPEADPYDVIDLDLLGEADLLVSVLVSEEGGLLIGDEIAVKWVGTTPQDQLILVEPPPQTVPRVPTVLVFLIPNADLRLLVRGHGLASYTVTRGGSSAGESRSRFATFMGDEQRLAKPVVADAVDGKLDPTLAVTTVTVPGAALEAGDSVVLTWLGIRANGTPWVQSIRRPISGGGAGKPLNIAIDGAALIAPLDGGSLILYYTLEKASGPVLESAREQLRVGQARPGLPAPFTRPAARDGVLDPEKLPDQVELVIPPWPNMAAGQTLYVVWNASSGPHFNDFIPVSPALVGHEMVFYLDRAHVESNFKAKIRLLYRVDSSDEPTRGSELAEFRIDTEGTLRVMGARSTLSTWSPLISPRTLTALDAESLEPVVAQWRYEGEEEWGSGSTWFDEKPWLKLYTRNSVEVWESQPANIIGNGYHNGPLGGYSAFVAIRDEVMNGSTPVIDMVAWGTPEYGGVLGPMADLKSVVEVSGTMMALAARQKDGSVGWWGLMSGSTPPSMVPGTFDMVRSNDAAFVGRRLDGELFAWGNPYYGVPVPPDVLQHKDYVQLYGGGFAFVGLRASGHIVAWGHPDWGGQLQPGQEEFDDIVTITSNNRAFAAIREHVGGRSVIAWGQDEFGGIVPDDIARLTNVRTICGGVANAFCILLETGEVKAWPDTSRGGQIPDAISQLTNVVDVTANHHAFCAQLSDGHVVVWGDPTYGGSITDEVSGKSDIVQVCGNLNAFAALCSDGTVVAWGLPETGGDIASVAEQLVEVRAIYGNGSAFTALTRDGRVVTWGFPGAGGDSSSVQPQLAGKVTARRLLPADEVRELFGDNPAQGVGQH